MPILCCCFTCNLRHLFSSPHTLHNRQHTSSGLSEKCTDPLSILLDRADNVESSLVIFLQDQCPVRFQCKSRNPTIMKNIKNKPVDISLREEPPGWFFSFPFHCFCFLLLYRLSVSLCGKAGFCLQVKLSGLELQCSISPTFLYITTVASSSSSPGNSKKQRKIGTPTVTLW